MENHEEYINIKELLSILKKRFFLILFIAIIATGLAWLNNYVKKETADYYASVEILFNKEELNRPLSNPQEAQRNNDMTYTYLALITSQRVLDEVGAQLHIEGGRRTIESLITANQAKNSNIIGITVHSKNPEQTLALANTTAAVFKAEVKKLLNVDNVEVLNPAKETVAVLPKKNQNLAVGFILGLALGVVLSFALEYLRRTFRREKEVENALHLPVLAAVPSLAKETDKLITRSQPNSPLAQVYRSLRTQLEYAESEWKSLLVTSAVTGEGKTVMASNLAVVLGEEGYKTLYVQGDLRQSGSSLFSVSNDKGLSTYLSGKASLDEVLQETGMANVSVLPAGPAVENPSQWITPKKIEALLQEVEGKFDRVVVDSPAVLAYADASIISKQVDGTLWVVRAGKASKETVIKGKQKLAQTKPLLFGVVLNDQFKSKKGME